MAIRRRRYANDQTGFAVIDAERDGDEIVLVGVLSHLEERERVRIRGVWHEDKRFGLQVKVSLAEPIAPSGDVALRAYLKRVKHIGATRADKLLARYGDGVRSRSRRRRIFPDADFGISSMNSTTRTFLCGATLAATNDMTSSSVRSAPEPCFTTNAFGT